MTFCIFFIHDTVLSEELLLVDLAGISSNLT